MNQNLPDNQPTKAAVSFLAATWNALTRPSSQITDIGQQRRAQLSSGLILVISLLAAVGAVAGQVENLPYLLAISLTSLVAYAISRTKYYSIGAFLFLTVISTIPFTIILGDPEAEIDDQVYIWLPLALAIASALINKWGLFFYEIIITGGVIAINFLRPDQASETFQAVGIIFAIGIVLIYLEFFREGVEKARLGELQKANQELSQMSQFLEERITERTTQLDRKSSQLEAASLVARSAAETTNIKNLLDNVVEQISTRFGFYHVGVFLSDRTRQKVYLAAASSEGGKKMLERGHSLDIGRQGVVGYSVYEKKPRVAQDIEHENIYFRNPDLPETRSEAALPLLIKNQAIGVLDIQSKEQNPFGPEDLFILQTMADQIALAIQNARLLEESQTAIEQLQATTSKSIQEAWQNYTGNQAKGYVYSAGNVSPLEKGVSREKNADDKNMQTEINLRGQKIGTISLKRSGAETEWTEKEQEFTEKIAAQIALAIENARLLEDSQRRAIREQTLNELTTRLSRSLDLENLLQNAVLELHKLPQVTDASVVIAPQEQRKQG